MTKRIGIVVSGGGSFGAYSAGTLARLNKVYDVAIGISTGSLICPFTLNGDYDMLKIAYTNINQEDIFDDHFYKPYPITSKGRINVLSVLISLLLQQKSIGTTKNLRKLIADFISEKMYNELKDNGKEYLVGAQNFAQIPSILHYFSSLNESYESMLDYMWASASPPMVSSLVKKKWTDEEGNFHVGLFVDGGVSELVGLNQVLNKNLSEVDILIHRVKPTMKLEGYKINNLLDNVSATINTMRYDIEFEYFYDKIRKLNEAGIKVNVYWLGRKLGNNSLVFNKENMNKWWIEGYESAYDNSRIDVFPAIKK